MKIRKILFVATALSLFSIGKISAQGKLQIQPVQIQSRWAKDVSPDNALRIPTSANGSCKLNDPLPVKILTRSIEYKFSKKAGGEVLYVFFDPAMLFYD